ncbi:hypothetical protein TWF569_000960 [Orbilia oligospora]|uniref:Uncharacterized protein n=1 Tax=Orbilia oligospora TaxID=2813651 RepID=A0A7C8JI00_ORBOL|nr:hypothetical protein TWF102_000601 [Orbilia oligospora]KAF3084654.1 hypothetical protein TWF103_002365 [Orbilia oligospora]KAF3090084.1 hypothetical protein TWF706_010230 [Orbilia oligospora]KAF3125192.1 hypothetical protein TWF703_011050 [Orbilia oligospora]KAF3135669.1 hypothetical protein TWF594_008388 [Orbilia oligospora]
MAPQSPQQPSKASLSSSLSSPPSPKHLHGHAIQAASPPNAGPRQSLKRSRDIYEVAIVSPSSSAALANQPMEVVDPTTGDETPIMFPPLKRQKPDPPSSHSPTSPLPLLISSSSSSPFPPPLLSPSSSPSPPPPLPPPAALPPVDPASQGKTREPEVIDLTADQTTDSSDSESTWSQSSLSSGSVCSNISATSAFFPPPQVLLPSKGPNPLGNNWEKLGPIDEFPEDPLMASYTPPSSYPFPAGVSSDIISANPEVAFLFHVKFVGEENYYKKPLSSADSFCFLPSTMSTSFFISIKMDKRGFKRLKRDMILARKIGFLPYRSFAIAVNAIRNYSRMNRRCGNPEWLDGVGGTDEDGDPLYLDLDWYPGRGHFEQMAKEWMETHLHVRGLKGVPGFASPEEWKTQKQKGLRKHNWEKWEAGLLKGRRRVYFD